MTAIEKYFNAEKAESMLFIISGVLAILFSIYFYFIMKENFWKGLAIPFLFFSIIQIVIGATIYLRSPKDCLRVVNSIKNEPQKIQTEEIPRMKKVLKNFVLYRYFEITMIILGILLISTLSNYIFWKGFGFGLIIQCTLLLSLDFFAEKRGKIYSQYLQSIIN